jgi:hypothetical protein
MGNGWAHEPRERSSGRLAVTVFGAGIVALAVCFATGRLGDMGLVPGLRRNGWCTSPGWPPYGARQLDRQAGGRSG